MATSSLRTMPPGRVVCRPMKGLLASARSWMISAAVWPCVAQCILFCTVAKNCCDMLRVRRVVHARRVNIEHLLVEAPLGRADVPDALQQLVEVILLPLARRVLQPLVVHGEALHQILAQARRGPLAELRAAMAAHAVADGENGVQIVVLDLAGDLPRALRSNYSVISE